MKLNKLNIITVVCIICAVFIWLFKQPPISSEANFGNIQTGLPLTGEPLARSDTRESKDVAHESNASTTKIEFQRLKSIARNTSLQVMDSKSLTASRALVELLGLSATQAETLNKSMKVFLQNIQQDELKHAYVAVNGDGNEEIVVSSFDRTQRITALRSTIAGEIGDEAAYVISEQLVYDRGLAVGPDEMRVHVETGDDGTELLVFSQKALDRNATDPTKPYMMGEVRMAPTFNLVIRTPIGNPANERFKHLLAAVDSLPRRKQ